MFYGKFDPAGKEAFNRALQSFNEIFGRVFASDNLIALRRSTGFLQDAKLMTAMERHAKSDQDKSLIWRLHTLTWAGGQCLSVAGDFVECGVFRGFSMAVVAEYLEFENVAKTLYLYDTFEGIPDEMNSEHRSTIASDKANAAGKDTLVNEVRSTFAKYPNVKIVQGIVPHSFAEACPASIAFLHIDMNSTKSEIAALEGLFDRVTPGGMIVFDDYGWFDYRVQRAAEDEFMAARGHQILELPTGQGLLVKK